MSKKGYQFDFDPDAPGPSSRPAPQFGGRSEKTQQQRKGKAREEREDADPRLNTRVKDPKFVPAHTQFPQYWEFVNAMEKRMDTPGFEWRDIQSQTNLNLLKKKLEEDYNKGRSAEDSAQGEAQYKKIKKLFLTLVGRELPNQYVQAETELKDFMANLPNYMKGVDPAIQAGLNKLAEEKRQQEATAQQAAQQAAQEAAAAKEAEERARREMEEAQRRQDQEAQERLQRQLAEEQAARAAAEQAAAEAKRAADEAAAKTQREMEALRQRLEEQMAAQGNQQKMLLPPPGPDPNEEKLKEVQQQLDLVKQQMAQGNMKDAERLAQQAMALEAKERELAQAYENNRQGNDAMRTLLQQIALKDGQMKAMAEGNEKKAQEFNQILENMKSHYQDQEKSLMEREKQRALDAESEFKRQMEEGIDSVQQQYQGENDKLKEEMEALRNQSKPMEEQDEPVDEPVEEEAEEPVAEEATPEMAPPEMTPPERKRVPLNMGEGAGPGMNTGDTNTDSNNQKFNLGTTGGNMTGGNMTGGATNINVGAGQGESGGQQGGQQGTGNMLPPKGEDTVPWWVKYPPPPYQSSSEGKPQNDSNEPYVVGAGKLGSGPDPLARVLLEKLLGGLGTATGGAPVTTAPIYAPGHPAGFVPGYGFLPGGGPAAAAPAAPAAAAPAVPAAPAAADPMNIAGLITQLRDNANRTNNLIRGFFYLMNRRKPVDLFYLDRMSQRANFKAYGRDYGDYRRRPTRMKAVTYNQGGGITPMGGLIQPYTTYEPDEDQGMEGGMGRPGKKPPGFTRDKLYGWMAKIKRLQGALSQKMK